MNDWKRSDDDPNVWIYKDRYTLRCEYLTWYLDDTILHGGSGILAHTHVIPSLYNHWEGTTPYDWAEIVVKMYEAKV